MREVAGVAPHIDIGPESQAPEPRDALKKSGMAGGIATEA